LIVSIIVAMDERGGIGLRNRLPWHLPDDLKRFKRLTMGHHLIIGRKTYQSIGKPLIGRKMIVLSKSQSSIEPESDVMVVPNLSAALEICREAGENEVFIGGGAQLFRAALSFADRLYLTKILAVVEADTFFPPWDESEWSMNWQQYHPPDEKHAFPFQFVDYVKKQS